MMARRWPQFPVGVHVRVCQECGHAQVMRDPTTLSGESWRDAKCRQCKSESLDFGSMNVEDEDE